MISSDMLKVYKHLHGHLLTYLRGQVALCFSVGVEIKTCFLCVSNDFRLEVKKYAIGKTTLGSPFQVGRPRTYACYTITQPSTGSIIESHRLEYTNQGNLIQLM